MQQRPSKWRRQSREQRSVDGPNSRAPIVSLTSEAEGEMQTIRHVLQLPPSESCNDCCSSADQTVSHAMLLREALVLGVENSVCIKHGVVTAQSNAVRRVGHCSRCDRCAAAAAMNVRFKIRYDSDHHTALRRCLIGPIAACSLQRKASRLFTSLPAAGM
jgi:hypothetical protein